MSCCFGRQAPVSVFFLHFLQNVKITASLTFCIISPLVIQNSHQDIMLTLTFLKTADTSKVNVCPKRGISCSQYMLISSLSYQGTRPLNIKSHHWIYFKDTSGHFELFLWILKLSFFFFFFLQEVSGFLWSVDKNNNNERILNLNRRIVAT